MISFDTNVLVYAADRTAGERHAIAVQMLTRAASADAALNDQSIVEFLHVGMRKRGLSLAHLGNIVRVWLKNFTLISPSGNIVEDTLSLLQSYRLSVWDAHMIAICASHRCDVILSEDLDDGALYRSVRVLNPFNPKNAQMVAEHLLS